MPVVFEKLAAQLDAPPFRRAEQGYDPEDVHALLAVAAERLAALEARVATAERRADKAEDRLGRLRLRRHAEGPSATPPVPAAQLADVVQQGERRAAQVQAEVAALVEAERAQARARVEELRRDAAQPELRSRVVAVRHEAERLVARRGHLADALATTAAAVTSSRQAIVAGLKEACP